MDGLELGFREGTELGLWGGIVFCATLVAVDGLLLGTYGGLGIGLLEGSTDGAVDGNLYGLLLGV